MNKRLTSAVVLIITVFVFFAAGSNAQERSTEMPAPRHPDIAVQAEYDAAVAAGHKSAYTLFIQRHPKHRLAQKMRELMRKKGLKNP